MLNYLWEASPTIGVEAAAGRATVRQPGSPSFDVNLFSLVGDFAAGPSTDVIVGMHRDSQGTPVTQNAYTRENRTASARVIHRWSRWTGQLALQGREVERVRGDQNFVDVPRWATLEGRFAGRISRDWRLSIRAFTQSLSKAPPMVTQDRRSLLIDGRQFAQLKLDGGKPELNGYLTWTNNTVENSARDARVTASLFTLGGNWEAAPALSVFAELTRENWTGSSEIATPPDIDAFAPDSTAVTLGANWIIDPVTYLSANFTNFQTQNANPLQERDGNTRGTFFTLNARRRLASGNEIGLIVAPWYYRDRLRGTMDYDARVVMVTGSARF
jgi:hypothetical protein